MQTSEVELGQRFPRIRRIPLNPGAQCRGAPPGATVDPSAPERRAGEDGEA